MTFSRTATALVAGFVALSAPVLAQEITVTHAQGETTLPGIPEKVLTQDWAVFDDLNALGITVAGVPSSNAPSYLADAIPADALQLGSLFEPDFEGIAASESDVYLVAARSAAALETSKDILPTIDLSVNNGSIIDGVKNNMTLLGEVFGQAGAHARSAVGVAVLPLDAPVEVEIVVEVAG